MIKYMEILSLSLSLLVGPKEGAYSVVKTTINQYVRERTIKLNNSFYAFLSSLRSLPVLVLLADRTNDKAEAISSARAFLASNS
jgi:hypothetical protein